MSVKHPTYLLQLTAAQDKATAVLESLTGLTRAGLIRRGLSVIADDYDVEWPDDMDKRGGQEWRDEMRETND